MTLNPVARGLPCRSMVVEWKCKPQPQASTRASGGGGSRGGAPPSSGQDRRAGAAVPVNGVDLLLRVTKTEESSAWGFDDAMATVAFLATQVRQAGGEGLCLATHRHIRQAGGGGWGR